MVTSKVQINSMIPGHKFIVGKLKDLTSFRLIFNGIYYVMTDGSEHPVTALFKDAKIVQPSEHHWLKVETNVVRK